MSPNSTYYKGTYPKFPKSGAQILGYEITGVIVQSERELNDGSIVPDGVLASRTVNFKGKLLCQARSSYEYRIGFIRYSWDEKYHDYSGYNNSDEDFFGGLLSADKNDKIIPFDVSFTIPDNNHYEFIIINVIINYDDVIFAPRFRIPDEFKVRKCI